MSFSMTGRPSAGLMAVPAQRMARKMRRPTHNAFLHFRPWYLTPFMAAPVVPGETLKNALFQARILSSPVKNQVVGWWIETYWFYCKHRHMGRTQYTSMMLDMSTTMPAEAAAYPQFHSAAADVPFTRDAYLAVVNEFFRGDGEAVATTSTALAKARLRLPGWWDSILPDATLTTGMGGVGDDSIGAGFPTLDQVGEVGKALEQWQTLRMLGVTNLEYDDWLRSFGVSIAAPIDDRPELVRYTREWQYPSSAVSVDATAQRVSSVLSWSLTERIDKDRYFKEPGVLLGVILARPKTYHDRQQSGIGQLSNAIGWMTPINSGSVYEHYNAVQGLTGYQFDQRDLYLHGDQWKYISVGTDVVPTVAFPADGAMDYVTDSEINALFVDGSTGHLKMDATINLGIASGVVGSDATPRTL